jgi:hypothetical protein
VAVRKETIKQQFNESLPAVLEPGERVLGGAYGVSGPNPLWVQGLLGLARFLLFGMRYYYALTDRRLIFMNASFWTSRPQGLRVVRPAGLDHDQPPANRQQALELGRISSPTKQNLRMNFHAFWRPELKAMGDLLADRVVGPRLAPGAAGDPAPSAGQGPAAPPAPPPPSAAQPPPPTSEG